MSIIHKITLEYSGDDDGIFLRCTCGWTSSPHFGKTVNDFKKMQDDHIIGDVVKDSIVGQRIIAIKDAGDFHHAARSDYISMESGKLVLENGVEIGVDGADGSAFSITDTKGDLFKGDLFTRQQLWQVHPD